MTLPLWQHGWSWRALAKWNKSVGERQIPYDINCLWSLKYATSESSKRNGLTDVEDELVVTSGCGGKGQRQYKGRRVKGANY